MARSPDLSRSPVARARLESTFLPFAIVGAIFAGHALFGANRDGLGLLFAMTQSLVFALSAIVVKQSSGRLLNSRPLRWVGALALLVLVETAASAGALAVSPWAALVEWIKLAALVCTGCAGLLITQKLRSPEPIYKALMLVGAVYIGACLLLYALAPGSVLGLEKYTAQDRFTATFVSANSAAMLCIMLLLVAASDIIARVRALAAAPLGVRLQLVFVEGWLASLVSVLATAGLTLTASRAGLILCAAALTSLVIWDALSASPSRASWVKALRPVALILAIGVVAGFMTINGRASQAAESAQFRSEIWQAHWPLVVQGPWFGYGLGAFAALNSQAITPENFDLLSTIGAMHNIYLQWLEQGGVVGAGLMFALVASVLWPVVQSARTNAEFSRYQRLTTVISVYVLAHSWFDYGLETPSIAAQWAVILGVGLATTLKSPQIAERQPLTRAKPTVRQIAPRGRFHPKR